MQGSRIHARRVLLSFAVTALTACGASAVVAVIGDSAGRAISASVGQEIDVTLGNVGPAIYASPPLMSSGVLTYLGVDDVPPYNPGGPTQRFRFNAVARGQAIVEFRRTLGDSVVSVVTDTVQVR